MRERLHALRFHTHKKRKLGMHFCGQQKKEKEKGEEVGKDGNTQKAGHALVSAVACEVSDRSEGLSC